MRRFGFASTLIPLPHLPISPQVSDIALEDYIAAKPKYAVYVPHSAGRYQQKRFRKAQCPIVERLACSLMKTGRNNGKKIMATRIVEHALDIVHLLTDQNPVQVSRGALPGAQARRWLLFPPDGVPCRRDGTPEGRGIGDGGG